LLQELENDFANKCWSNYVLRFKLTWAQSAQGELLWPAFVRRRASCVKVVQTVPFGCISRSRGQKIGFQNAIYIASSRGPGVTILHRIIYGKVQTASSFEPLMVIWLNSTGMVPGWSPTIIVQIVLIGCICRSRGQKIGLQKAIFKNLLL